MLDMPLAAYPDEPIYNMKAITQRTNIPAATLRAWERRYHALQPRRSGGNYRLYSERDVAVLRWLQSQLVEGFSISRAVALLEKLRAEELGMPTQDALVMATQNNAEKHSIAKWERLFDTLYTALTQMDEQQAGVVLAEAFALYSVESICAQLIVPVLVQLGEDWHAQRINITQEHFATAYLMGRLQSLYNSTRMGHGALILVGCAPGEQHEVGALMLALLLRRAGHNVRYLGANVPLADLAQAIKQMHPRVVALSAVLLQSALELAQLPTMLSEADLHTHLVFGGGAFALAEVQGSHVQGAYISTDLGQVIPVIERLLLVKEIA